MLLKPHVSTIQSALRSGGGPADRIHFLLEAYLALDAEARAEMAAALIAELVTTFYVGSLPPKV